MQIHIGINDHQTTLDIDPESVRQVVVFSLEAEGASADEVEIHFVDTPTISDLHAQFFDDPTTTDCITLPVDPPGTEPYCLLGEVFVCPETAIQYANAHDTDVYRETTLYVVHGILHLLGYKDIEEDDIAAMRGAEHRIMTLLHERDALIHKKG